MNNRDSGRPIRTQLDHSTHYAARFDATFFITICCETRLANQLCQDGVAQVLFETVHCYHDAQKWYRKVLLLMPDHLHMLVGIPGDANLSNLVRDFNGSPPKSLEFNGNETFFDHRLRHGESEAEKFEYICQNPVRAGLAAAADQWQYVFVGETAADFRGMGD